GIRTHGTVARTRHFQCRTFGHSATPPVLSRRPTERAGPLHARTASRLMTSRLALARQERMAEGRGFEPPRDSRPYPISSRTPSTGLGHPSAWSTHDFARVVRSYTAPRPLPPAPSAPCHVTLSRPVASIPDTGRPPSTTRHPGRRDLVVEGVLRL